MWHPMQFSLVVDNLGIKHVRRKHIDNLTAYRLPKEALSHLCKLEMQALLWNLSLLEFLYLSFSLGKIYFLM